MNISFINDYPDNSTVTVDASSGEYFLNVGKLEESIEDNGAGGVMRVSNMEFEVWDKGTSFHWFADEIFGLATNYCIIKVKLKVSGTWYPVFIGMVDLQTVEYPMFYDDGSGTYSRACKFIGLSVIANLKTVTTATIKASLLNIQEGYAAEEPDGGTIVGFSLINIFRTLSEQMFSGVNVGTPVISVEQTYKVNRRLTTAQTVNADQLYLRYYSDSTTDTDNADLWTSDSTRGDYGRSLISLANAKEMLIKLSAQLLAYPIVVIDDIDNNVVHLEIKGRSNGSTWTASQMGTLLSSTKKKFAGYDAIKVSATTGQFDGGDGGALYAREDTEFYPGNIGQNQFDLYQQKYEFISFIGIDESKQPAVYLHDLFGVTSNSKLGYCGKIVWQGNDYDSFTAILMTAFSTYWGDNTMYEQEHVGVGIGGNYIELLDKNTISGVDYPMIKIERDFKNNTKKVTSVQF